MVSNLAAGSIGLYQLWLSPRKGFSCPHRLLHEGSSCSEYAKRLCRERGLGTALRSMRTRFRECREAALKLKERRLSMATAENDASEHKPGEGFEFAGASETPPTVEAKKTGWWAAISSGCDGIACCLTPFEACG